jgi:hypothetical protein
MRGMTVLSCDPLGEDDSPDTLLACGGEMTCAESYDGYAAGVVDVGGYIVGSG